MINVTRPSLASLSEVVPYLEKIWESGIMTHNGPLVQQLEKELAAYLDVPDVVCVANGTCALQLAIRALDLQGEIITTPFTFIATASIISWERCRPVFVDIDEETWNMDPIQVEGRITEDTCAILPVHVFGCPCDTEALQQIADRYSLRVIYDGAHAMAVNLRGRSVFYEGDISAVSFHATKLFNTAEGGACVTSDEHIAERLRRMRFFGYDSDKEIVDQGMNAKMTEVHAALGLANLGHLDAFLESRRRRYESYRDRLSPSPWLKFQKYNPDHFNYSYMPVLFESEDMLHRIQQKLIAVGVLPKRYFYPALNTVSLFDTKYSLPIAEDVARRVLCLPLYDSLEFETIEKICDIIMHDRE